MPQESAEIIPIRQDISPQTVPDEELTYETLVLKRNLEFELKDKIVIERLSCSRFRVVLTGTRLGVSSSQKRPKLRNDWDLAVKGNTAEAALLFLDRFVRESALVDLAELLEDNMAFGWEKYIRFKRGERTFSSFKKLKNYCNSPLRRFDKDFKIP